MSKEDFFTHHQNQIDAMTPEERHQMEQDMAFIVEDDLRSEADDMKEDYKDNE